MTRSKIPTARVEFDEAIDLRTTHSGSNRRHVLTIDGVTRNLREWEHVSGIPRNVIRHRLNRGWELDDARAWRMAFEAYHGGQYRVRTAAITRRYVADILGSAQ